MTARKRKTRSNSDIAARAGVSWRSRPNLAALTGLCGVLLWAGLPGCRQHGDRDLLLRELRQYEDRAYYLEGELAFAQAKLKAYEKSPRSSSDQPSAAESPTPVDQREEAPEEPFTLPTIEITPSAEEVEPAFPQREADEVPARDALDVPPDSPRTPVEPMPEPADEDAVGADFGEAEEVPSFPGFENSPNTNPPPGNGPPGSTNAPGMSLDFNRLLTSITDFDGGLGGNEINVVIEPRDERGRPFEPDGTLSLVLVEAGGDSSPRRLGRWEVPADELHNYYRDTALGPGLHLELPCDEKVTSSGNLRLVARFVTPRGEKLFAEHQLTGSIATVHDDAITPVGEVQAASHVTAEEDEPGSATSEGWKAATRPSKPLESNRPVRRDEPDVVADNDDRWETAKRPPHKPSPSGGRPPRHRPTWSPYR